MILGYGYMRNNLVFLGGYPTHRDVADMSNLFYFYSVFIWSRGMTHLPRFRLLKRSSMNKNQYKRFRQPVKMKIMQMRMCQFKLAKYLFLSRGYEHVSSLARWNRLYIDTKILLSQAAYRDIFSIKTPRYYVTIKTFFMKAAHFQCYHNRASIRSGANVNYLLLDSCHVTVWSRCQMTCWVGSSHSSYHPAKSVGLPPCEDKDEIFLICHVSTWWICYVTLWVESLHPKSWPS